MLKKSAAAITVLALWAAPLPAASALSAFVCVFLNEIDEYLRLNSVYCNP